MVDGFKVMRQDLQAEKSAMTRYLEKARGAPFDSRAVFRAVPAQADDAYATELLQRKQRAVPGDNGLGAAGKRALENAVVRIVLHDAKPLARLDHGRKFTEEDGNAGQFLRIARKLACEHAEQLIQDRLGNQELIPLLDHALQGRVAASARKDERGNENVGVEYDPQARR